MRNRSWFDRMNRLGISGGGGQVHDWRRTVTAKTASFTITQADSGKLFTNRGDTDAMTITLPTVTSSFDGVQFEIYAVEAQDMILSATTAGQLVVANDAAANSIGYITTNEEIGSCLRVVCDGTSWLVIEQSNETFTPTITT